MTPDWSLVGRRTLLRSGAAIGVGTLAGCLDGLTQADDPEGVAVEEVVDGLANPWAIEFFPEGSHALVTERSGQLNLLDTDEGEIEPLDGAPEVFTGGQGGLLDVAFDPDFEDEPWVYLTYSAANGEGSTTHLGRGRFEGREEGLVDFEELYAAEPFVDSGQHFGSRVVFDEDGLLYMTVGDRGFKDFGPEHVSQDTENDLGTTLRLEPDGSIPEDNPFVDEEGFNDAIFTYGHRNVQGMTIHPETGDIWQAEHGEQDGDEINALEEGGNYGWPVTHTGCEYNTDDPVGEHPEDREDVVNPVYYWECNTGGFPPAGTTFYDGDAFPDWEGDLFVGTLAGRYLGRFTVDDPGGDPEVEEAEALLEDRGWRIRDVTVQPETGYLYVAVDDSDAPLVRLVPE